MVHSLKRRLDSSGELLSASCALHFQKRQKGEVGRHQCEMQQIRDAVGGRRTPEPSRLLTRPSYN